MHLPHTYTLHSKLEIRNVPRSDCSLGGDLKCFETSLDFFINFCNISGLRSNFQSVEHHLFSTNLIFFSSPKHSFLRQPTVAPFLFLSIFSILIFVTKLDVVSLCATT
ncbi:hypothetical protein E2C01_011308 [Portunus trituberculatus]|uniref:Uncharacterized protein n=1 Tax=Portunus trituberculatus TaxID=210409 RepID=A0A5B7DB18_PORTR|nr:hypothetical protein [Portunus trituberculatus]